MVFTYQEMLHYGQHGNSTITGGAYGVYAPDNTSLTVSDSPVITGTAYAGVCKPEHSAGTLTFHSGIIRSPSGAALEINSNCTLSKTNATFSGYRGIYLKNRVAVTNIYGAAIESVTVGGTTTTVERGIDLGIGATMPLNLSGTRISANSFGIIDEGDLQGSQAGSNITIGGGSIISSNSYGVFLNRTTGDQTPFHCEVYFVNKS